MRRGGRAARADALLSVAVATRWVHHAPILFAVHDVGRAAWVIVAGYTVAAILCGVVTYRERSRPAGKFWLTTALIVAGLGINKQLDFQTWLTFLGRRFAQYGGWYAERRAAEVAFLVIFTSAILLAAQRLAGQDIWRCRGTSIAVAGLAALAGYALLRATTFYHIDTRPEVMLATVPLRDAIEFGGTLLVAIDALRSSEPTRSPVKLP